MTSSVLDGAGCESPAPPAFSPLTDPAPDPGNREPSVLPTAAVGDAPPPHDAILTRDLEANGALDPKTPTKQEPPHAGLGDAMQLDPPPLDAAAAMDYTTTSPGLDLYSQHPTQLLMALARLSAASQPHILPLPTPSTVRPSQVSLPPHALLDSSDAPVQAAPDGATHTPPADAPLESFARIEFADSVFQMTTYAVIIGRDQRALDQARRDERRLEDYQRRVRENEQLGLPAPSPPTQDRGKFSKSYVSEEGGMLGPESDGEDNPRPAKKRKTSGGNASASGDSHQLEVATGEQSGLEDKNPALNRQYVSHTPGAAAVNLSALRPSPYYVPFIGIHSPGPNIASRTKAISREHLRIEFNQKEGVFEAIPLHKNGFFCEDVHYKDNKVVLKSGDRLQIKDVDFVFIINGVARGKTGAEDGVDEDGVSSRRYSEGGKEMSFDFESSHNPERRSTSPEDAAVEAAKDESDSELSEPAEDIAEPEAEEVPEQEVMETIEKDSEVPPSIKSELPPELYDALGPIPPRKRGPGRPPKNGIMSKREERLRRKAAIELAKKNMPQPPPGEPPIKRKVGRPRKHPLPENAPDRPEKRKYKPRKPKDGQEGDDSDPEKTIKERRREKPKTPPLELNRADYSEEQLQKPPKNYGMLIDEVLSAAPDGLTLKQIYKRIQMKYPYFYFEVDTKGWESSVRHNLIGNDAFKKNDETHLWSRVPGIDIDAGKKRKATSPDRSTSLHGYGQPYSTSATPTPHLFHAEAGSQGYRPGSVPQRPGYAPAHGQMAIGQHPQAHLGAQTAGPSGQQAPRQAYPLPAQASGAAPTAGFTDPATARPPQGSTQATAYSSPYASRPPPAAAAHPAVAAQVAARQGLPPGHVPSPYNGLPRAGAPSAQTPAPGSVGPRPAQPALNGKPLTLKPAVAPELVKHVTNFKKTVTEQLSNRTSAAEALAMSVINRGLGLATESTIPEEENLEKIVFGVFESTSKNLGANGSLHPGLVQALVKFKNNMIQTLESRMGKLNAERLILSAIDRVLGFADRSTIPGTEEERKPYDEAETVLITAIRRVVTEHQRTLAAVASASAPQSIPGPGPAPTAPTVASVAGSTPTSATALSAAAAPVTGVKPAGPASTNPAPVTQPAIAPAHAQQAPPPAMTPAALAAQPVATPASVARAQPPSSGPVPSTAQTTPQSSGISTAASTSLAATQAENTISVPGAVQTPVTNGTQITGQPAPAQSSSLPAAKAAAPNLPPTVHQPQGQGASTAQPQAPIPATTAAPLQGVSQSVAKPAAGSPAPGSGQVQGSAPSLGAGIAPPASASASQAQSVHPPAATPQTPVEKATPALAAPVSHGAASPAQPPAQTASQVAAPQTQNTTPASSTAQALPSTLPPPVAPSQTTTATLSSVAPQQKISPPAPAAPQAPAPAQALGQVSALSASPAPVANMTPNTATASPVAAPPPQPTPPPPTAAAAR